MTAYDNRPNNRGLSECFTPDSVAQLLVRLLEPDEMHQVWPQQTVHDPTCGNGQLLAPVLAGKLASISAAAAAGTLPPGGPASPVFYGLAALSSISGIEYAEDNAQECRDRLAGLFCDWARTHNPVSNMREAADDIMEMNIVCGDTLTYLVHATGQQIRFPCWVWDLETGDASIPGALDCVEPVTRRTVA